ncbi:MAG: DNA mismatch repair endonuclease MutL [Defluviitaleaceae bacterium]|nr:DNA mismatch repair endonuclease MutL [Defluviitaleaceae bacterium]
MIKVLENSMINKIAAGEVVERPLSVIKELAENSIDAGATSIEIEIKDGGTSFMRVRDNGKGIPKSEVKTAFLRHATSKIAEIEDLESVLTMGFRGEALSSIASVAQVVLVTKTEEQSSGVKLELDGGDVISETDVGTATGTEITVRNLFANVPARRKFLKKPAAEGGYISDIINKLALGNPGIAFKYINNNSTILQTRGDGNLKNVIFSVYGKEVAGNLIELRYQKQGVTLDGFIGKPSISRGNRNYSLLYINGRYVRSDITQSAVEEAYKTKLTQGKFPFCVMRLGVAPESVDVNVHPTKLEVRFSDEDLIYRSVYAAVDGALRAESLIPVANTGEKQEQRPAREAVTRSVADILYDMPVPESKPIAAVSFAEGDADDVRHREPLKRLAMTERVEQLPVRESAIFTDYRIIGQIFNTYWIIEQGAAVYLIDQHAAHERVLYENLAKTLKAGNVDSQKLVQPIIIPVSQTERQCIRENLEFFSGCGFEVEEFDLNSFVLYSVPFVFGAPSGAGFFIEILDSFGAFDKNIEDIYDAKLDKIASISCKAAVKANDRLSGSEARGLIEQALKLENPFTCPHGRPTIVELSKTMLEKLFKRIQP